MYETAKAQLRQEKTSVNRITEACSRFANEISKIPGAEKIMTCFQCGTCTGDCPIARFSNSYRPRQIIRMTQLGLRPKVLSSQKIWLCAGCYTCTDRCPQDVEVASVLRVLRNLAVQEGFMPSVYRELASNVLETGYAYMIPRLRLKKREEEGLPSLPRANLENLVKLFDLTGLSKILEGVGT